MNLTIKMQHVQGNDDPLISLSAQAHCSCVLSDCQDLYLKFLLNSRAHEHRRGQQLCCFPPVGYVMWLTFCIAYALSAWFKRTICSETAPAPVLTHLTVHMQGFSAVLMGSVSSLPQTRVSAFKSASAFSLLLLPLSQVRPQANPLVLFDSFLSLPVCVRNDALKLVLAVNRWIAVKQRNIKYAGM